MLGTVAEYNPLGCELSIWFKWKCCEEPSCIDLPPTVIPFVKHHFGLRLLTSLSLSALHESQKCVHVSVRLAQRI